MNTDQKISQVKTIIENLEDAIQTYKSSINRELKVTLFSERKLKFAKTRLSDLINIKYCPTL